MEYIAYIYDKNGKNIAQIFDIFNINLQEKLNDISTLSFSLYHDNRYSKREFLSEYNRVKINILLPKGQGEKTYLEGYITSVKSDLYKNIVTIKDYLGLFERAILFDKLNAYFQPKGYVASLVNKVNENHNLDLELVENELGTDGTVVRYFAEGTNYLDIIKGLMNDSFEIKIKGKKIYIKSKVGEDKSSGPNFVEYRYNINEYGDRNIKSISVLKNAENISNEIKFVSPEWSVKKTDSGSIEKFGKLQERVYMNGEDGGAPNDYIKKHSISSREFNIVPVVEDYFEVEIGDIVKVYVDVGNDLMFINEGFRIVRKSFKSPKGGQVSFALSTEKVTTTTLNEKLKKL
ncbi:MAG: hypothetical protein N4A38_04985 [Candidatus Gracilibacteria bacterium]|nr:hypothetical protein [Candidatus Gracilibacteria bacterium]